ncbi:hypothetical protein AUC45_11370 [Erythrobacter sp. YT30]|nr:hypothetical protein AUC45_11370 [Erythrobacter sp. YT30]
MLSLSACGNDEASPLPNPAPVVGGLPPIASNTGFEIARLADGPHMGIIVGFDDLSQGPFDRQMRSAALLDEAASSGASISRIQLDWPELETQPGQSEAAPLAEALETARQRGQLVFVTLSTLDSDGLTLPEDLLDGDGKLRDGLSLASPEVLERFQRFLDWMVPLLGPDVWALSMGNEVDSPIADGLVPAGDALVFYQAGARRIKAIDPDLATTVTLTIGAPSTVPDFAAQLNDSLDVATVNHYCLDAELQIAGQSQWERDVQIMKDMARGRPIMIQELGCPVSYAGDPAAFASRTGTMNGSQDLQAEYFAFFDRLYAEDPQFRAATVFQLFDWSPELAEMFGDFVRAEGEPLAGDRLEEWLATVGTCRWSDGTCRPAWDVWLASLSRQSQIRAQMAD